MRSSRKALVVAGALWLAAAVAGASDDDPRVAWLAEHAVPIRSLDVSDGDFSDLEPLRAKLAGVRVVMLGEATHGDGTTFLAKNRLIRFLHEEMGFDVLAFESGMYDCAKAWDLLNAGEPARQAVSRGVFGIWTRSRQVHPLIDYIGSRAKSERPLELAGTDCQLTSTAPGDFLLADLSAYLSGIDPKLVRGEDWDRFAHVLNYLVEGYWELGVDTPPPPVEQAALLRTLDHWRSVIACDATPATVPWSGAFWRQYLASLRENIDQTWRTDPENFTKDVAVFAMRDRQMGKNLVWLAKERYPNRKIIVWAATFHNARNLGSIETADPKYARLYPGVAPMGEVAWRELGDALYSLGFVTFEGEAGRFYTPNPAPIPPASAGSLEDLCARAGLTNALIDFRSAPDWLRAPRAATVLGHVEMRADWTGVVDGVVFLRRMERSNRK